MKIPIVALALVAAMIGPACSGDESGDLQPIPSVTASPAPLPTLAPATPTIVASQAALRLLAPAMQPGAGGTFAVAVDIRGATNLAAFQFSPVVDSSLVELVNIIDGGFLASSGRVPTCSLTRAEQVTFFCVSGGAQPPGPSGDGRLATIEFRALAVGVVTITLEGIAATMPDATDIPLSVEPITVAIQ